MKLSIALASLLVSLTIFAHGMNKPGPHGGFIRMPSNYNVELVDLGKNFKVYLLDINFKNPTIQNSNVSIEFNGVVSFKNQCTIENEYFICEKPNNTLEKYEVIIIQSSRENVKASPAVYKLPLKLE